jgi:carbon-monoxide dehydrogenase medium subunit
MQVPAPVDYERALSLDHAIELLERYGPDAKIIAGGHSLLPMMKLRLLQPEVLIDLNNVTDLGYIKVESNEMRIGALTRHSELLESPIVSEHFPIISEAERVIADPVVRNRGTVGGSLCQADPSEDLAAVFSALKASVVLRGSKGTRVVPVREFHSGPYSTVIDPGEILTEIRVSLSSPCGSAYKKVERRVGDWAIAAVGVVLRVSNSRADDVGIGLTAVGAEHYCAYEAEEFLVGKELSEETINECARIAAENCNPSADQRGPVDYKRHLVEVLTFRALGKAVARCKGGSQ